MSYILIGVAGFGASMLFDPVSLYLARFLKPIIWAVVTGLLGYAHVMVNLRGELLPLPLWLAWIGWPLFLAASLAMIYSLFLEIPFNQTYVEKGVGNRLVTTGTYALSRHPGVLWYALVLIGLILISRRMLVLIAAPVWLSLDILYVWLQDRFFFPRMFPGYDRYQMETPMLLPNRRSIARCLRTLRGGERSTMRN